MGKAMKLTRLERGSFRLWIVVAGAWNTMLAFMEPDALLALGVIPSIALLFFGTGILWAVRGFKGGA